MWFEVMVLNGDKEWYRLITDNRDEAMDWAAAQEKKGFRTRCYEHSDEELPK